MNLFIHSNSSNENIAAHEPVRRIKLILQHKTIHRAVAVCKNTRNIVQHVLYKASTDYAGACHVTIVTVEQGTPYFNVIKHSTTATPCYNSILAYYPQCTMCPSKSTFSVFYRII